MSNKIMIQTSLPLLIAIQLLAAAIEPASSSINFNPKDKIVVIMNAHWNFLSVRCFSFDDSLGIQHLRPWQQFVFKVHPRTFYPTATMYNCSTNMGTFVAYRYDHECAKNDDIKTCLWKFDLNKSYYYSQRNKTWSSFDYNPNYESLALGGVVEGRYVN